MASGLDAFTGCLAAEVVGSAVALGMGAVEAAETWPCDSDFRAVEQQRESDPLVHGTLRCMCGGEVVRAR